MNNSISNHSENGNGKQLTMEQMENQIRQNFLDTGISLAGTLSALDLILIANNAYCYEERIALIPTKTNSPQAPIRITQDKDPQLFMHMILRLLRIQRMDLAQAILNNRSVVIEYATYLEYIDMLQACVRCLQDHPEMTDLFGTYIAHRFKQDIDSGERPVIAPNKPMISIHSAQGEYLAANVQGKQYNFRYDKSKYILIPGAGLSTVNDLRSFASIRARGIILNDKKEFTTTVLRTLSRLFGINNTTIQDGNFNDMNLEKNSVGIMILSLIHSAGETAIGELLEKARGWITQGGLVVTHAPSDPANPGDVTPDQMGQLFTRTGFQTVDSSPVSYRMPRKPMLHSEAHELSRANGDKILGYINDVSSGFQYPAVTMTDILMVHRNTTK